MYLARSRAAIVTVVGMAVHGRARSCTVTASDPLRHLVAAAVEGDDAALTELIRQTQPVVWRLCARLGSKDDVADLVQDTYMRAIRALPAYRGDAPVRPWLLSIARRVCADHVRRRQRERRLVDRVALHHDSSPRPAHESIDDLLDVLDDDRRDAFVLTQYVGLSYEESAVVLGCAIGTIRSRVARARAQLLAAVRDTEEAGS